MVTARNVILIKVTDDPRYVRLLGNEISKLNIETICYDEGLDERSSSVIMNERDALNVLKSVSIEISRRCNRRP